MKRSYGYIASIVVASVLIIMPVGTAIAIALTGTILAPDTTFSWPEFRVGGTVEEQLDAMLEELRRQQQQPMPIVAATQREKKKKYTCNLCQKKFYRSDRLLAHETAHTGVKPFQCDICDATFSRKERLHTHRDLHFAPNRFQCPSCGTPFTQKHHRKKHVEKKTCTKNGTTTQALLLE